MDRQTYEVEARVEQDHWWFRGRRRILRQLIADLDLPAGASGLDVGCGTGANGSVIAEGGRFAVGVDMSAIPLGLGRTSGHSARVRGDVCSLPFADNSFDLVCALDILEHIEDDARAARELMRVARPGAPLIVFVPAFMVLWGLQDDVSHHLRRYGKREVVDLLEAAGLETQRVTFFNSLLFLPILGARLAMRVARPPSLSSENQLSGPLTNALLGSVFNMELPLLRRANLPVGVSLAVVGRKP